MACRVPRERGCGRGGRWSRAPSLGACRRQRAAACAVGARAGRRDGGRDRGRAGGPDVWRECRESEECEARRVRRGRRGVAEVPRRRGWRRRVKALATAHQSVTRTPPASRRTPRRDGGSPSYGLGLGRASARYSAMAHMLSEWRTPSLRHARTSGVAASASTSWTSRITKRLATATKWSSSSRCATHTAE
eukprot:654185-Prymnesium_polylepis.1